MNTVILHFVFGLLGTVAYCYLFHIPKKYYLSCGLIGGAGWLIYILIVRSGLGDTFAALISSVFVALASRIVSLYMECPSTVFLYPGLLPIIPGGSIYETVYFIVANDTSAALMKGLTALKIAVAMVIGIVIIYEIPQRLIAKLKHS